MGDRETVELLWRVFTDGSVPIPDDPGTWRVRGQAYREGDRPGEDG